MATASTGKFPFLFITEKYYGIINEKMWQSMMNKLQVMSDSDSRWIPFFTCLYGVALTADHHLIKRSPVISAGRGRPMTVQMADIFSAAGYDIGYHLVTRRISPASPFVTSKSKYRDRMSFKTIIVSFSVSAYVNRLKEER